MLRAHGHLFAVYVGPDDLQVVELEESDQSITFETT